MRLTPRRRAGNGDRRGQPRPIRPDEPEEIHWYASTGEPRDKAGAYGVQGLGARFIEEIHGSFTNVMGLPARGVYSLLRASRDPALALLALSSA